MPTKKYLRKKVKQLCIIGEIMIESHSFLKILTEPLKIHVAHKTQFKLNLVRALDIQIFFRKKKTLRIIGKKSIKNMLNKLMS